MLTLSYPAIGNIEFNSCATLPKLNRFSYKMSHWSRFYL